MQIYSEDLTIFAENLASHWTAPDLHAVIFCIYTQFRCTMCLCMAVVYYTCRKPCFSLLNLSIESQFHEWCFLFLHWWLANVFTMQTECPKAQWRQRCIQIHAQHRRLLNFNSLILLNWIKQTVFPHQRQCKNVCVCVCVWWNHINHF